MLPHISELKPDASINELKEILSSSSARKTLRYGNHAFLLTMINNNNLEIITWLFDTGILKPDFQRDYTKFLDKCIVKNASLIFEFFIHLFFDNRNKYDISFSEFRLLPSIFIFKDSVSLSLLIELDLCNPSYNKNELYLTYCLTTVTDVEPLKAILSSNKLVLLTSYFLSQSIHTIDQIKEIKTAEPLFFINFKKSLNLP